MGGKQKMWFQSSIEASSRNTIDHVRLFGEVLGIVKHKYVGSISVLVSARERVLGNSTYQPSNHPALSMSCASPSHPFMRALRPAISVANLEKSSASYGGVDSNVSGLTSDILPTAISLYQSPLNQTRLQVPELYQQYQSPRPLCFCSQRRACMVHQEACVGSKHKSCLQ